MEFMSITTKPERERFHIVVRQEVIKIDKAAFVSCAKLTAITLEDAKKIVENALCAIRSDGEKE